MPLIRYDASKRDDPVITNGWPAQEPLLKDFPTLLEFLSLSSWPNGEERTTGTMTISCYQGRCSICLNDRDQERSQFVSADTLKDAFKAAEKIADGSGGGWRPTRWGNKAKKPLSRKA